MVEHYSSVTDSFVLKFVLMNYGVATYLIPWAVFFLYVMLYDANLVALLSLQSW
jgi:hypothetical protein